MITIDFTYYIITPESAEHGDFDSHGFIEPGFWKYPMDDNGDCGYDERNVWQPGDLSGLVNFAQSLGIGFDGDSLRSVDPDCNYRTGEDTFYSMHISGCTDSTLNRIQQLFRC